MDHLTCVENLIASLRDLMLAVYPKLCKVHVITVVGSVCTLLISGMTFLVAIEILNTMEDISKEHVKYGDRYSQDYDVEDFEYSDDREVLIPNDVRLLTEESQENCTKNSQSASLDCL